MPRIRATCPHCGDVELRPDEVELHVVGPDADDVRDGSTYLFDCPECAAEVVKPADGRIARLLTVGGVPTTFTDVEATEMLQDGLRRVVHPEGLVMGEPFTVDDLLDFHELLQTDDWFARLSQTC